MKIGLEIEDRVLTVTVTESETAKDFQVAFVSQGGTSSKKGIRQ